MKTATTTLAALALTALAGTAGTALAEVTSSSGDINVAPQGAFPGSVAPGGAANANNAILFQERVSLTTGGPLNLNWTAPGAGDGGQFTPGTIAQGEQIGSYFFHIRNPGPQKTYTGSVVFGQDEIIVGLIYGDALLDFTDALIGVGAVTYNTGEAGRGLGGPNDQFTISANRSKFSFNIRANTDANDQLRIITQTVPTPGALALLGTGGLLAARRRR